IPFMPARVLLQDFTGVPAVVDLAAMRDAMRAMGGEPARINPLQPADLVIDHSVQVDVFGTPDALRRNTEIEFERNRERYAFLRWGQQAFGNFRVVPPDTGIVHQVNLEYLAPVVFHRPENGLQSAYPDPVLGTDSHTTTIATMGPEYGATIGFFPIDAETLVYLRLSGRDPTLVALVEAYARAQGLFRTADTPDPVFSDRLELDLGTVEPSLAGPRRPQD